MVCSHLPKIVADQSLKDMSFNCSQSFMSLFSGYQNSAGSTSGSWGVGFSLPEGAKRATASRFVPQSVCAPLTWLLWSAVLTQSLCDSGTVAFCSLAWNWAGMSQRKNCWQREALKQDLCISFSFLKALLTTLVCTALKTCSNSHLSLAFSLAFYGTSSDVVTACPILDYRYKYCFGVGLFSQHTFGKGASSCQGDNVQPMNIM